MAEMRLVLAEMRLVLAEMRLVQITEMRLVPWAPPAFLEGGGWGGGGGRQNRARGRHLTATNMLSAFSGFNQRTGGGGCCCLLSTDSTNGVGTVCLLLANSTSVGRGGGVLSTFG